MNTVISPAKAFQPDLRTYFFDLTVARDGLGRDSSYTGQFKTLFVERVDGECYLYFNAGDVTSRIDLRKVRRLILPRKCETFWIENPAMAQAPNKTGCILLTSMDAVLDPADIKTTPEDTVTVGGVAVTTSATFLLAYSCQWFTLFNESATNNLFWAVDRPAVLGDPIVAPASHLDIFVNDTGRVSVISDAPLTAAVAIHR